MLKTFKTLTFVDGDSVDIQYSNWQTDEPGTTDDCVVVTANNELLTWNCDDSSQKVVCQSQ